MNGYRLIQSAEMLKPPTPTTAADETLVEYFPHLFLLQNQCKPSEFTPDHIKMMQVCCSFNEKIRQLFFAGANFVLYNFSLCTEILL